MWLKEDPGLINYPKNNSDLAHFFDTWNCFVLDSFCPNVGQPPFIVSLNLGITCLHHFFVFAWVYAFHFCVCFVKLFVPVLNLYLNFLKNLMLILFWNYGSDEIQWLITI